MNSVLSKQLDKSQQFETNNLLTLAQKENIPAAIFVVRTILLPITTPSSESGFEVGTIVRNKSSYGIVVKINSSDTKVIRIAWWKKGSESIPWWHKRFRKKKKEFIDDIFDYPIDYLKPLKIESVPNLIPKKTLLKITAGTSVVLENEEVFQFSDNDFFLLSSQEELRYILVRPGEKWVFPIPSLPAEPIAYLIDPPTPAQLAAANRISRPELSFLAKHFLCGIEPEGVLERVKQGATTEAELKALFKKIDPLQGQDYLETDLEEAWHKRYEEWITWLKSSIGISGYRVSDRVVATKERLKKVGENMTIISEYTQGTIEELDLRPGFPPFIITWELGTTCSYTLEEFVADSISLILPHQCIGKAVAYEVSADGKYYKVYIGFRNKPLAKSWQASLKRKLGYIGNPVKLPNEQKPPGWTWKYCCTACNPKQKTMTARIRNLQTVATWNLEEPLKYYLKNLDGLTFHN